MAGTLHFGIRVEDHQTLGSLKAARRDLNKRLKEGLKVAGTAAVLPRARRGAPRVIALNLKAGATVRGGFITTQGPRVQDKITGLLNFGGRVTTEIVPTDKQAIKIGNTGEIRANVKGPRTYRGKHFLERDVEASLPDIEEKTLPSIMRAFDGIEHTP